MDRQSAINVLRRRIEQLPYDDTNTATCLFYERIDRKTYKLEDWSAEEKEAVECVIQKEHGRYISNHDRMDNINYMTYSFELDGDVEMLVSYIPSHMLVSYIPLHLPSRDSFRVRALDPMVVRLKRRGEHFKDSKLYIPLALRINVESRVLLRASDGIVDKAGEYLLVIPNAVNILQRSLSDQYEKCLEEVRSFQRYFLENWVQDTKLVIFLPTTQGTGESQSRTGKTSYFYKVFPYHPIAGYAESFTEIECQLGNTQGAKSRFVLKIHNPNELKLDQLRQEIFLDSIESLSQYIEANRGLREWFRSTDRYDLAF